MQARTSAQSRDTHRRHRTLSYNGNARGILAQIDGARECPQLHFTEACPHPHAEQPGVESWLGARSTPSPGADRWSRAGGLQAGIDGQVLGTSLQAAATGQAVGLPEDAAENGCAKCG